MKDNHFEKFRAADKILGFRMNEFVGAKKVLTPAMLDFAVKDGIALRALDKNPDFGTKFYGAIVRLERKATKVNDIIDALHVLNVALVSDGCHALRVELENCKAVDIDAVKERVVRYASLVRSTCADVHLYGNVLDNHYVQDKYTDAQRACARRMCAELNLTVVECNHDVGDGTVGP